MRTADPLNPPTNPSDTTTDPAENNARQASEAAGESELRALLARLTEGDEASLTPLYQRLSRRIYAYALQRLGQVETAEEVVVETMYEVWQHAGRFRHQSRVTTWVLGIARHKSLDKLRQRGWHEVTDDDDLLESLPDESPGAFELIADRQLATVVRQCMELLPDVQRECLHYAFYEDMPLADIALLQGCPENTVKTRLFHARRRMRELLSRRIDAERP